MQKDNHSAVTIAVDFGAATFYPLIKTKMGFFNSAYVPEKRWQRDAFLLENMKPASLRYEIGWGMGDTVSTLNDNYAEPAEYDAPQIYGNASDPQIHFETMDSFVDSLNERHIPVFLIDCYNPEILQNAGDVYTDNPNNLTAWYQINQRFANHFRSTGRKIDYYEIWNEPDLDLFFTGTQQEFFEVYKKGAEGVRSSSPDAKVGGAALAYNTNWGTAFLNYVSQNQVPLDFFSFHVFGNPVSKINAYRNMLSNYAFSSTTELILSEFNPYSFGGDGPDFSQDGKIEKARFAPLVLDQIKYFLEQTDLVMVNWAQFNDPSVFGATPDRCAIVNNDGRMKAAYNAFAVYADMPVDRCAFSSSDSSISGMASTDGHKSATVIWNNADVSKSVSVNLSSVPFSTANMKVYRIDSTHASFGDDPGKETLEVTEHYNNISTSNLSWTGDIPAYGVVYITVDDGTYISELARNDVADVIKTQHYFFERNKKSYAFFDPYTWIAHLSMVNQNYADTLVGVIAENMPASINVQFDISGNPHVMDVNSLLGIRIDYMVNGSWEKGVLFHGGLYNANRTSILVWGAKRAPDQVVQVTLSNFNITLAAYAPQGWNNGRVLISFEMQNTGSGSSAKVYINKQDRQDKCLLTRYDFTSVSGNSVIDVTGNGNDGTLHNSPMVVGDGFIGSAICFNGINSYITLPNKIGKDFTIGFWIKTTDVGGIGHWHSGKGLVDADAPDQQNDFGVTLVGDKLAFGIGGIQDTTVYSQTPINDGKWHYCTAVRKGTTIQVYVDGVMEAASSATAGTMGVASQISLGRINTGFNYLNGCMDELVIYNYALSKGQIKHLCEKRFLRSRFSFNSSNPFIDESGNQFDMTAYQVSLTEGISGNAIAFNGTNSYATIPRCIMDDFTISFFIKTLQSGNSGQWYAGIGVVDADTPGAANDFGISVMNGRIAFGIGKPDTTIVSQSTINDGTWHHVAVTRSRVSGVIEIYIDGIKETSGTAAKHSLFSTALITIGKIATNSSVFFNGCLDELVFYNKVLDSKEILAISQQLW